MSEKLIFPPNIFSVFTLMRMDSTLLSSLFYATAIPFPLKCSSWVSFTHLICISRSRPCGAPAFRTYGSFHQILDQLFFLFDCCYLFFIFYFQPVFPLASFVIRFWSLVGSISSLDAIVSFSLGIVPYCRWC